MQAMLWRCGVFWTEECVTGGGLRQKSQTVFHELSLIFSSASLHNIKIDAFHFVLMHRSVNCHKITQQANGYWILTCIFVLFSLLNLWFLSPISLICPSPPNKYLSSSYSSHMCCSASESLPWLSSKGSALLSLRVYMYERANILQATRLIPICR